MTIAERKAREAYDRENPSRSMSTAKPSGLICELLFNDMAGDYWRPAYVMLSPERRALIARRAKGEDA